MNHHQCPIIRTLRVMGGKWKPVILFYLREAPLRPAELGRLIPSASAKVLTQQLRELERDKIVQRKVFRQVPPKVEYSLAPLGESLRPVLDAMCDWARSQSPFPSASTLRSKARAVLTNGTRRPRRA
ncbi:MAG: helix-turn-helix domain-containing protein [Verrucomicrobiota bacterium]